LRIHDVKSKENGEGKMEERKKREEKRGRKLRT
jgi:hypothetical protein